MSFADWSYQTGTWLLVFTIVACFVVMVTRPNSLIQDLAAWYAAFFGPWGFILMFGGWLALNA
jgi:hypothetical protein